MSTLLTRKIALETLLKQKIEQYRILSTQKDQLSNELIELNGKLTLLKELIAEMQSTVTISDSPAE